MKKYTPTRTEKQGNFEFPPAPNLREWEQQKRIQMDLVPLYKCARLEREAKKLLCCGWTLSATDQLTADGELKREVQNGAILPCRMRSCPMCGAEARRERYARLSAACDALEKRTPCRWLFLTLTLKNCPAEADALRDTLHRLSSGYTKLWKHRPVYKCAIGAYRTTEVTFNARFWTFHPHIHALVAVSPDYFGDGYLSQSEWVRHWKQALSVDYDPSVRIEAAKADVKTELTKYTTKHTDIIGDAGFSEMALQHRAKALYAYHMGLKGARLYSYWGELKPPDTGKETPQKTEIVAEQVTTYEWRETP